MKVMRIRNWDKHYENNRTRSMVKMQWVPVPNNHDGDGYTVLVDHDDGAAHLGVWLVLLQVASRCNPRGTLLRSNGHPHDTHSVSRVTRIPQETVRLACERLASSDIGWIEVVDMDTLAGGCQEGDREPAVSAHPTDEEGREGREWNRKKGKGGRSPFVPPSIEDLREYAAEKYPQLDCDQFMASYEQKGWMVGKNKMKDWRAAVRNWKANGWGGKSASTRNRPDTSEGRDMNNVQ